jgi:hypothetical protein
VRSFSDITWLILEELPIIIVPDVCLRYAFKNAGHTPIWFLKIRGMRDSEDGAAAYY